MATPIVAEQQRPGPMVPRSFRVTERKQDTVDTWTLTLEALSGSSPSIAPGQFMMVYAFGIGEVPISVSGPPGAPGPVVLTVRAVGAVTTAICRAEPGAILGLRGPLGTAWPVEAARGCDVIIMAGGIGLAPLRPVVLHLLEQRDGYGTVTVLYGARTPGDLLYTGLFDDWRRSIDIEVTVDAAGADWAGRVGVVTKLLPGARFRPEHTTAFVCGPEIMMRFGARALLERGLTEDQIIVSMERHMDCGIGLCGHCQLGPTLICRDGPVYPYSTLAPWLQVREL